MHATNLKASIGSRDDGKGAAKDAAGVAVLADTTPLDDVESAVMRCMSADPSALRAARTRMLVRPGDILAGRYQIDALIGIGGMGVVMAGRHVHLGNRVAIKFLQGRYAGDREAVRRFMREARAAARLKSEHVARVVDVGALEGGLPFYVMEYLEGTDLATMVKEGPLPVGVAVEYVAQACRGMAEAHAFDIVHRDLKPSNLVLTKAASGECRVKVIDFGVSKLVPLVSGDGDTELTSSASSLGSPPYMSPEQVLRAKGVDARADVWSLGVTLFELLTGLLPFQADTLTLLFKRILSRPPLPLRALRSEVPAELEAVVARCLAKEREERIANAAELGAALAPFAARASR